MWYKHLRIFDFDLIKPIIMTIYENLQPTNFDDIKTYELASRPSKVTVKDFAAPVNAGDSLKMFLSKFPNILAVQSLREIAGQIKRARELKNRLSGASAVTS